MRVLRQRGPTHLKLLENDRMVISFTELKNTIENIKPTAKGTDQKR